MQRKMMLPIAAGLLLALAGCGQQAAGPGASADAPAPLFKPTATIQDIMDTMVDPPADYLWGSTGSIATAAGIEDKSPKNDEDWLKARYQALILIESTNLLLIEGRRVADDPLDAEEKGDIEDPAEIQKAIDANRAAFNGFAGRLHDVATTMLKAVDAKDIAALEAAGEDLDAACEQCHRTFWYPNAVEPIQTLEPPPGFTGEPAAKQ